MKHKCGAQPISSCCAIFRCSWVSRGNEMRGMTRAAPGAGTCKLDEPRSVLSLQVTSDLFLMHNIYCNLLRLKNSFIKKDQLTKCC